jgi:uncharacterized membrane protein YqhA
MTEARALRPLPSLIFASRWLQLPLYLGLIVAQAIYVWLFAPPRRTRPSSCWWCSD